MRFHVQKAVTDRLDTYFGAVASQMRNLELDGKIAKYVSRKAPSFWLLAEEPVVLRNLRAARPSPASTRTQPATATSRHPEAHPRPSRA